MAKEASKNQILLEHMAEFARFAFMDTGQIIPMWLLQDADGKIQPVLTPFHEGEPKETYAKAVKSALKEHKAVRYGFMSEAWAVSIKKDHPDFNRADKVKPSTHPDRREVIKLVVEDDQGSFLIGQYFILRPENGAARLSPFIQPEGFDGMGGTFGNMFTKV